MEAGQHDSRQALFLRQRCTQLLLKPFINNGYPPEAKPLQGTVWELKSELDKALRPTSPGPDDDRSSEEVREDEDEKIEELDRRSCFPGL